MSTTTRLDHPCGSRLDLDRLFADPPLVGAAPDHIALSSDGAAAAWLAPGGHDFDTLDLWVCGLPDGTPRTLVRARDLADVRHVRLSEAERAMRERLRSYQHGIMSFAWCGPGAERVVFPLAGNLFLAYVRDGRVDRLSVETAVRLDVQASPRGSYVSFVAGNNLCVLDLRTGIERWLTHDGSDTVSNGLAEFIAQEEMGRHHGHFWSGDEAWLAFLRVDEASVGVQVRPRIHADRTELYQQRYPAAGGANATVDLYVAAVDGSGARRVPLPREDGYVARMVWSADIPKLWIQWQSRDQRRVVLYEASAPQFDPQEVWTEADDAWVPLTDDFLPLAGGDAFLWSSERGGSRQILLYRRVDGAWRATPLTACPEPVTAVLGVDAAQRRVFFTCAGEMGRQQHVCAVPIDGGDVQVLTREPGWHDPVFAPGPARFIDVFSTFVQPPRVRVLDDSGRVLAVVDDNPARELLAAEASDPQWVQIEAADGTPLNGVCLEPVGRRAGVRYPALVHVYAGPGIQLAARRFLRHRPLHMLLNQLGFGVFLLDGHGTPGRDRAFSRSIHHRLGDIEIEDQVLGARWLASQPWVDPSRIGIWGWSYGGYASLMALLRDDTPFRAAAAIAPVTDWRLYDTHYTERYLGLPQANALSYERADVLPRARRLNRPLLLVHGMADDNVLFEHSLRLMEELQQAGIVFELMVYPGRGHGLDGRSTQLHLYRTLFGFFQRHLGPEADR